MNLSRNLHQTSCPCTGAQSRPDRRWYYGISLFNYVIRDFFQKFKQDTINITTTYPGAIGKLIESSITTILKEDTSDIQGIDMIELQSYQGESFIKLTLKFSPNIDEIANQILDEIKSNKCGQYKCPVISTRR